MQTFKVVGYVDEQEGYKSTHAVTTGYFSNFPAVHHQIFLNRNISLGYIREHPSAFTLVRSYLNQYSEETAGAYATEAGEQYRQKLAQGRKYLAANWPEQTKDSAGQPESDAYYFRHYSHEHKPSFSYLYCGENLTVNNFHMHHLDHLVDHMDISAGFHPAEAMVTLQNSHFTNGLYIDFIRPVDRGFVMGPTIASLADVRAAVERFESFKQASNPFKRKHLACMINSHDSFQHSFGPRKQLMELLTKEVGIKVLSPGRLCHNTNILRKEYNDNKVAFLKDCTFNLCPENTWTPSYVTEKLVQAIEAGCVPIYWGGICSEADIFNLDAIVYYDPRKPNELVEQINRLLNDPAYQEQFVKQPWFRQGAAERLYLRFVFPYALTLTQITGLPVNAFRSPLHWHKQEVKETMFSLLADARQAAKHLYALGQLEDKYLHLLDKFNRWPFSQEEQEVIEQLIAEAKIRGNNPALFLEKLAQAKASL